MIAKYAISKAAISQILSNLIVAEVTATTALPAFSGGASTGSASATVTATTSLPTFSGSASVDGTPATVAVSATTALPVFIGSVSSLSDSQKIDLILDILSNRQTLDATTGLYTLYADDGVTVLKTAQAWEDSEGTQPYRGRGLKRLDALQ